MKISFIPKVLPYDILKGLHFPTEVTEDLAEIVGIMIGDGHMGYRKSKRGYLFQLYGDKTKDRMYYDKHITNKLRSIFGLNIKPRQLCNKSVYGYQFFSKSLVMFLSKNFSIPLGKKTHIVRIPHLKSRKLKMACLRGLIDTDFGMVCDKERPTLQGWFANKDLVNDISIILNEIGIRHSMELDKSYFDKRTKKIYNRHRIRVRRINEIDKWYNSIGTKHPVMQVKYLYWKSNHKVLKDIDIMNIFALGQPQSI